MIHILGILSLHQAMVPFRESEKGDIKVDMMLQGSLTSVRCVCVSSDHQTFCHSARFLRASAFLH
jgi:hypothetical protein